MYTVVVCSNCRFVWIVEDRPGTSQCRRCQKRRKFKQLKKYYQVEDLEAAKLARAHAQAMVNDQESRFEKELENGTLEFEIDEAVPNSTYLDEMGVDSRVVSQEVDQILHENRVPTSKSGIVDHALNNQGATSLDEFVQIIVEHGLTEKEGLERLKKRLESGRYESPDDIPLGEIEEALAEAEPTEEKSRIPTHSTYKAIFSGLRELNSPTEEDLLEYTGEMGMGRADVEPYLSKLIENGKITKGTNGVLRRIR